MEPQPLNLISNQFKWALNTNILMPPNLNGSLNNNIVPGGPGPFNLMSANQFKSAPYNNI